MTVQEARVAEVASLQKQLGSERQRLEVQLSECEAHRRQESDAHREGVRLLEHEKEACSKAYQALQVEHSAICTRLGERERELQERVKNIVELRSEIKRANDTIISDQDLRRREREVELTRLQEEQASLLSCPRGGEDSSAWAGREDDAMRPHLHLQHRAECAGSNHCPIT